MDQHGRYTDSHGRALIAADRVITVLNNQPVPAGTHGVVVSLPKEGNDWHGAGSAALASWSNTLSDLTGYRPDYIRNRLLTTLPTQYGVELITAAGDLCPITFLVTLTASQKEAASA
jgi:hypothetical protein